MLTTKLVDADQISRPISTLSLPKKEIKPKERERRISVDKGQRGGPRDAVRSRDTVDREQQRRIRRQGSGQDRRFVNLGKVGSSKKRRGRGHRKSGERVSGKKCRNLRNWMPDRA